MLTRNAHPISATMTIPFRNAEKLPATIPERIVNEAHPSREAVTTSRTCPELLLVNSLVNSGMMAAANVPKLMIEANFHRKVVSTAPPIKVIFPIKT